MDGRKMSIKTPKKLILASASPRRRELLSQIGLAFEVRPGNTEENAVSYKPAELVMELSALKAEAVFEQLMAEEKGTCVVLGADTVVACGEQILGKPGTPEKAKEMLQLLQGGSHQVYTGVTILSQNCKCTFFEKTEVTVYPMTKEEIESYTATGEPVDKAGAYGIQGRFAAYIKGISGDYNNVVGLPTGRVYQELKKAGLLPSD